MEPGKDGYFRVTFDNLRNMPFPRRWAFEDSNLVNELRDLHLDVERAGYCEWEGPNSMSLGFGWIAIAGGERVLLAPGGVSSNVMLTSTKGYDLGPDTTEHILGSWLSGQLWQQSVATILQ
jgi:hypothetical protein